MIKIMFILLKQDHLDVQKSHEIHLQQIIGIFLFFIAYYQQYVAHVTLANLRKSNFEIL